MDLTLGRLGHSAGVVTVAAAFSRQEAAALVSLVVTLNARNAIGVSTRARAPGSYHPWNASG
jgi:malonyl CoA-acyl carrier protein transacylase